MPYNRHEVCCCAMLLHHHGACLLPPDKPSVPMVRAGPGPRTVGPSCCEGSTARLGGPRAGRTPSMRSALRPLVLLPGGPCGPSASRTSPRGGRGQCRQEAPPRPPGPTRGSAVALGPRPGLRPCSDVRAAGAPPRPPRPRAAHTRLGGPVHRPRRGAPCCPGARSRPRRCAPVWPARVCVLSSLLADPWRSAALQCRRAGACPGHGLPPARPPPPRGRPCHARGPPAVVAAAPRAPPAPPRPWREAVGHPRGPRRAHRLPWAGCGLWPRRPGGRAAPGRAPGQALPPRRRLYDACPSAARSWAQPWRVVRQAAGMRAGDPPRFVVPAWAAPPRRPGTQSSRGPAAMAPRRARRGKRPGAVRAPRRPPAWRTRGGCGVRVPPPSCTRPGGPRPSTLPRWPRPTPRRSS